jgi:hypothetical protein
VKLITARGRFVAALGLYLIWAGILAAMALTSAERPPSQPLPSATSDDATATPSTTP